MGNWNISINGIGAHHNKDNPTDANKLAKEFVKKLKAAGQTVEFASFDFWGGDNLVKDDLNKEK